MDLNLSPQDEAFREEVRQFLDAKLTKDLREADKRAGGVFADFDAGHRWYKALAERGWIAPNWPTEHGGAGWNAVQRYIFHEECARANAPRFFNMAVRMVGPVIIRFGTPEQKQKYLPRIISGEDVWCQGYSEPGSGSDLASLKTRAERQGDHYIINGTKIWTTFAHHATSMFLLVRTSGQGKPQDGISFLLIDDIKSPGITIKPIITLAGDHEVNQVFFDNVKVPVANRIGDENAGWTVAKYLLEFERGGDPYSAGLIKAIESLRHMAAQEHASDGSRLADDPYFQQRLAEAEIDVLALEYAEKRIMAALSNGQNPGAASSMMKIRGSETLQKLTENALEAIGNYAQPFEPEARAPGRNVQPFVPDYAVTTVPQYLNHRDSSIYAGSNEIQSNILSKQMLGL
jgi:alkylation response protein AidB-like acyl-CoA dehydrogenase